jgi:pyrroline-5-carboxylate reductase
MNVTRKIAIIGGGNLGASMAHGLLKRKFVEPADLWVTRRNLSPLSSLGDLGVRLGSDNSEAVAHCDVIIMALKPYNVKDVLGEISPVLDPSRHLVISVVTGLLLEDISRSIGPGIPVFRAMPNTAIAIGESVTCICHNKASATQADWVADLFNRLGVAVSIDEKLMDAATVLGACGIAYALRYIRANIQGGIEIGFDAKTASLIAAQTVKGAAELLIKGNRHPEQEIDKVTTPKGCTIAGLNEMEHQGFSSSLIKGITASYNKIVQG